MSTRCKTSQSSTAPGHNPVSSSDGYFFGRLLIAAQRPVLKATTE